MNILLTGGAGYIGSHTAVELIDAGHSVIIVDSLVNSSLKAIDRVQQITGNELDFYQVDLRDKPKLQEVFNGHKNSSTTAWTSSSDSGCCVIEHALINNALTTTSKGHQRVGRVDPRVLPGLERITRPPHPVTVAAGL